MFNDHTLAILGAGSIGQALLGGLIGDLLPPERIIATRRSEAGQAALRDAYPDIQVTDDNAAAVADATIVLIACKPYQRTALFDAIRPVLNNDALVISVLAGIHSDTLARELDSTNPIVRAMPNTPALVDAGATALAAGTTATQTHLDLATAMFEAVGTAEVVSEKQMDAVTGLSGSGPAYVFMFIEALTDAGVRQGLPRDVAARLSTQTVFGAAKLTRDSGEHPAILRDGVTTPGGTAIAAVSELEAHGLRTMIINAVETATRRSRELNESDE
ncbi:pyrroline-5-carboxylate reductase [Longimonas halophila]|uniref:Pyrroline-5-carboxylate reductase n=1 Tax=Longimonas halophila TaxID=1469170 RepID=A0A2H3NQQ7_9BACT|nr:pyrroline-5-carboxylate reductase [Longimonas halophila]PEN09611.1 pyrroline-5-carboxylate reductase [Longimonas halophila]